jgi:hypothetical protein
VITLEPGVNFFLLNTMVDKDQYNRVAPTEAQLQAQLEAVKGEINSQGGEIAAVVSVNVQSDPSRRHPMMEGPGPNESRLLFFINKK